MSARLRLFVIERGGRFAIRLRDRESAARREFSGLSWFDVSEAYRISARFVAYPKPKPVTVPNDAPTLICRARRRLGGDEDTT